ncbi:probable 2,3,4,5-tetrahydropyridine-2-carboxylate n-succinyltransferase protein [Limnobacter sp. MED105]|nr:probable 2,3,4,5-tetrahydropyridine-2-carboxylate n-succinyltransferase protein [Limnobacter sp. MED105]
MTTNHQSIIEAAWENRADISPSSAPADVRAAVGDVLEKLNTGELRVCSKESGEWVTHQWIKKPCCFLSAWKTQAHGCRWLHTVYDSTTKFVDTPRDFRKRLRVVPLQCSPRQFIAKMWC